MSLLLRHRRFILSCRYMRPMSTTIATMSSSSSSSSSSPNKLPPIIPPSELRSLLSSNPSDPSLPRTIPMDASWFLPNDPKKRTGKSSFASLRPSSSPPPDDDDARFFDLDEVASHTSPYPHMLPTASTFAKAMREMRITRADNVVVYESPDMGMFSAPRAAWTLKVFQHVGGVSVLDNFRSWVDGGLDVVRGAPNTTATDGYKRELKEEDEYPEVQPDLSLVATFEDIYDIAKKQKLGGGGHEDVQILDARPNGRFTGADPEPRPGIPSGHVPGAISVPFGSLLDADTKKFLPPGELRKVFEKAGVKPDPGVRKISMCGTGVTAVIVDTALRIAGFEDTPGSRRKVYDGSWTEWAQRVKEGDGMIAKG